MQRMRLGDNKFIVKTYCFVTAHLFKGLFWGLETSVTALYTNSHFKEQRCMNISGSVNHGSGDETVPGCEYKFVCARRAHFWQGNPI